MMRRLFLGAILLLPVSSWTCSDNTTHTYKGFTIRIRCAQVWSAINPSGQINNRTVDLAYIDGRGPSNPDPVRWWLPGVGSTNANTTGYDSANVNNQIDELVIQGSGRMVVASYPTTLSLFASGTATANSGTNSFSIAGGSSPVTWLPNGSGCTNSCVYSTPFYMVIDPNSTNQEIVQVGSQSNNGKTETLQSGTLAKTHYFQTVTATTTSGSNVLTSVSSTSNMFAGNVVSGTGIEGGSTIVAGGITANTLTLSMRANASGTVSVTVAFNVLMPITEYPAAESDFAAELAASADLLGSTYPGNPNDQFVIGTSSGAGNALRVLSDASKATFLTGCSTCNWWGATYGPALNASHTNTAWTVKGFVGISTPTSDIIMEDGGTNMASTVPILYANQVAASVSPGGTQVAGNLYAYLGCIVMTAYSDPANIGQGSTTCHDWEATQTSQSVAANLANNGIKTLVMFGDKDYATPPDQGAPWKLACNWAYCDYTVLSGFHGMGNPNPGSSVTSAAYDAWMHIIAFVERLNPLSSTLQISLKGVAW